MAQERQNTKILTDSDEDPESSTSSSSDSSDEQILEIVVQMESDSQSRMSQDVNDEDINSQNSETLEKLKRGDESEYLPCGSSISPSTPTHQSLPKEMHHLSLAINDPNPTSLPKDIKIPATPTKRLRTPDKGEPQQDSKKQRYRLDTASISYQKLSSIKEKSPQSNLSFLPDIFSTSKFEKEFAKTEAGELNHSKQKAEQRLTTTSTKPNSPIFPKAITTDNFGKQFTKIESEESKILEEQTKSTMSVPSTSKTPYSPNRMIGSEGPKKMLLRRSRDESQDSPSKTNPVISPEKQSGISSLDNLLNFQSSSAPAGNRESYFQAGPSSFQSVIAGGSSQSQSEDVREKNPSLDALLSCNSPEKDSYKLSFDFIDEVLKQRDTYADTSQPQISQSKTGTSISGTSRAKTSRQKTSKIKTSKTEVSKHDIDPIEQEEMNMAVRASLFSHKTGEVRQRIKKLSKTIKNDPLLSNVNALRYYSPSLVVGPSSAAGPSTSAGPSSFNLLLGDQIHDQILSFLEQRFVRDIMPRFERALNTFIDDDESSVGQFMRERAQRAPNFLDETFEIYQAMRIELRQHFMQYEHYEIVCLLVENLYNKIVEIFNSINADIENIDVAVCKNLKL